MKLLLHVCCAPCAAAALEKLEHRFSMTAYFFNPNIYPGAEYSLRLGECRRYMLIKGIELLEGSPAPEAWSKAVKGLEGEAEGGRRCEACFRFRLEEAAQKARTCGFDCFASTLSSGPQKNAAAINEAGAMAAEKFSIRFLTEDFKKKDGFRKAVSTCKKHGIYRQDYCGCEFSLKNKTRRTRTCAE